MFGFTGNPKLLGVWFLISSAVSWRAFVIGALVVTCFVA
jgi:hypothetical protein